jgi:hypothetical protein
MGVRSLSGTVVVYVNTSSPGRKGRGGTGQSRVEAIKRIENSILWVHVGKRIGRHRR